MHLVQEPVLRAVKVGVATAYKRPLEPVPCTCSDWGTQWTDSRNFSHSFN